MSLTVSKKHLLSIRFVLFLMLTTAASCLPYPVSKQLQPESIAVILDENNHPIERAQVSLITSSYPYNIAKGLELKLTNTQGIVRFDSKHEWRIEMLMNHSSEVFFWNWCVYKPGYETYLTTYQSTDEWQDVFTVSLTPGVASECNYKRAL